MKGVTTAPVDLPLGFTGSPDNPTVGVTGAAGGQRGRAVSSALLAVVAAVVAVEGGIASIDHGLLDGLLPADRARFDRPVGS